MSEREYEVPRTWVVATRLYICAVFVALLPLSLTAENRALALLGICLSFAPLLWWVFLKMQHRTVRESREGLIHQHMAGNHAVIAWASIERFETMPMGMGRSVAAVLAKDRRVSVGPINARGTTRWDDGETDDIVGELNRRLEMWKAACT